MHREMNLPFLPDLHSEMSRYWGKPYSFQLHLFQLTDYANVEGVTEYVYAMMPPVQETFASYLSNGELSSLKTPALPSIALRTTLHRVRLVECEHHGSVTSQPG